MNWNLVIKELRHIASDRMKLAQASVRTESVSAQHATTAMVLDGVAQALEYGLVKEKS